MKLKWIRKYEGIGSSRVLFYADESGDYKITRQPYCQTGHTFTAFYQGKRIPLSFSSRLKDAQAYAQKHADGAFDGAVLDD